MTKRRRPALVPLHPFRVIQHMLRNVVLLSVLAAGVLAIGMAIYHFVEGLAWPDAFVNAAMLLGGMGPVNTIHTTAGKWLAGAYALFAGLFFITAAGVMTAPVLHHLLQSVGADPDD